MGKIVEDVLLMMWLYSGSRVLSCAYFLMAANLTRAADACMPQAYNDVNYYYCADATTRPQAVSTCRTLGYNLVVLGTETEFDLWGTRLRALEADDIWVGAMWNSSLKGYTWENTTNLLQKDFFSNRLSPLHTEGCVSYKMRYGLLVGLLSRPYDLYVDDCDSLKGCICEEVQIVTAAITISSPTTTAITSTTTTIKTTPTTTATTTTIKTTPTTTATTTTIKTTPTTSATITTKSTTTKAIKTATVTSTKESTSTTTSTTTTSTTTTAPIVTSPFISTLPPTTTTKHTTTLLTKTSPKATTNTPTKYAATSSPLNMTTTPSTTTSPPSRSAIIPPTMMSSTTAAVAITTTTKLSPDTSTPTSTTSVASETTATTPTFKFTTTSVAITKRTALASSFTTTSSPSSTTTSSLFSTPLLLEPGTNIPCHCGCHVGIPKDENQQHMFIEEEVRKIQTDLHVDRETLSSTIRKKTSIHDKGPSVRFVGFAGTAFLSFIFGSIVILDLTFCARTRNRPRTERRIKKMAGLIHDPL